MHRLARHAFTLVSAVSLLLCIAVCALWVRSYWNDRDRVTRTVRGTQYRLVAADGRLTLFAPPRAPAVRQVAWPDTGLPLEPPDVLVSRIANQHLHWDVIQTVTGPNKGDCRTSFSPSPGDGFVDQLFPYNGNPLSPSEVIPALMTALEDPERFVVAHFLLMSWRQRTDGEHISSGPDGTFVQQIDGMRVALVPIERLAVPDQTHVGPDEQVVICSARVDAAQIPELVRRWHERLDRVVASIPLWQLFATALVLPSAQLLIVTRRSVRGRLNRKHGRCASCGYDLRASPGRCPECGAVVPPAAVNA